MKTKNLFLTAVVVACAFAAPAFAGGAPTDPGCQPAVGAAGLFEPSLAFLAGGNGKGGGKGGGEEAICSALCYDGSYVTCSGTSCNATDNTCSTSGGRGSCYGSSTGNRYCPKCPSSGCTVTATCSSGGSVSCTGSCSDSFAFNDCYAYCDGVFHWCSNPPPYCPLPE